MSIEVKDFVAIIDQVSVYVSASLKERLSPRLLFHNSNHTYEVVAAAGEIGANSNLTELQLAIVTIAAWFHDCGYTVKYKDHEDESKRIANDFLKGQSYPDDFIRSVLACIEATRYPQQPRSIEEMVICDADLYHFTKPDYPHYEEALRLEWNDCLYLNYSRQEWEEVNCSVLLEHTYFTEYGKNVLQKFKDVNLERLKCK